MTKRSEKCKTAVLLHLIRSVCDTKYNVQANSTCRSSFSLFFPIQVLRRSTLALSHPSTVRHVTSAEHQRCTALVG